MGAGLLGFWRRKLGKREEETKGRGLPGWEEGDSVPRGGERGPVGGKSPRCGGGAASLLRIGRGGGRFGGGGRVRQSLIGRGGGGRCLGAAS